MQVTLRDYFLAKQHITIELNMAPPVDIGTIASTDRASGFYAHLDKDLVGLFVINGRLYICLNNIVHEVSPKTTAEYSRNVWPRLRMPLMPKREDLRSRGTITKMLALIAGVRLCSSAVRLVPNIFATVTTSPINVAVMEGA